jgi:hypothetical protein
MQNTRQMAVRHVGIDPALFHHFQVAHGEKAAEF